MATATIPIFDPEGTLRDVPQEQLAAAVKAGGMPAIKFQAPDKSIRYVPASRTQEAAAAGGKILPFEDQDVKHPGVWSTLLEDAKGMATGVYHAVVDPDPMISRTLSDADKMNLANQQATAAEATNAERAKQHGQAYSLGASANEMLGVNVAGEEKSAEEGDAGGVLGHALTVPALMGATEGITRGAPAAAEAARPFATRLAENIRDTTPKQAAQVVGAAGGAAKAGIGGAYFGAKGAGRLVESVLGKDRANAPIVPRPLFTDPGAPLPEDPGTFPGAPLPATPAPEQINPALVSPARTLPGMVSPEVVRPPAQPIPARPGLQLAGEVEAQAAAAATPEPIAKTPAGDTIPRTLSGESALRQVLPGNKSDLMAIAKSRGLTTAREAQLVPGAANKLLMNKIVNDFSPEELDELRSQFIENSRMGNHNFGDISQALQDQGMAKDTAVERAEEAWNVMKKQTYFPDLKIPVAELNRAKAAIAAAKTKPAIPSAAPAVSTEDLTPKLQEMLRQALARNQAVSQ